MEKLKVVLKYDSPKVLKRPSIGPKDGPEVSYIIKRFEY
jgi:hypothetical protein